MRRHRNKKNFFLGVIAGFGISFLLLAAVTFLVSDIAFAQVEVDPAYGTTFGLGTADLMSTIIKIVQWVLGFLGLIAVIMIIYGGFVWMTAAGNEEKVAKAKKIIIRAVIGLAIVLLAWAITLFIMRTISDVTGGGEVSCTPGVQIGCQECNATGDGWFYNAAIPGCGLGNDTLRIRWVDPGDGDTNVILCSIIQAVFNEEVDPASVPGNAYLYVDAGAMGGAACVNNSDCASGICDIGGTDTCQGDEVPGTWQLEATNEAILVFFPDDDYLENTLYRMQLDGGVGGLDDAAGTLDSFAGWTSWFTTGIETLEVPPYVYNYDDPADWTNAIYPNDGGGDICLNTPIQSKFSSKMRVASINTDTVILNEVGMGNKLLKTPFTYSNPRFFSTRPAELLTAGAEYEITLIAGMPGDDDPANGIMDVCLNHLDGNVDGTAGDDFMPADHPEPAFASEPWNFFADADTTNTECIPEITGINPPNGNYDDPAPGVNIIGSNFAIGGNVFFNQQVIGMGNCFNAANFPNQNCVSGWAGADIDTRIPGGPPAYDNNVPTAGAKDGGVYVEVAGEISNSYGFNVTSPQIKKASGLNSQPHGGVGQYVTISKRTDSDAGFGDIAGTVFFRRRSDGAEVAADIPPDPPCASTWSNDYIIIKVNDLTADLGVSACAGAWTACVNTDSEVFIQVQKSDGSRSNLTKFIYTNEDAGPGLCGIVPNTCGTGGDPRTLEGENFGGAIGNINFTINPNPPVGAAITSWADQSVDITVPNIDNADDPYDVTVTNAVATSNGLPFTVPCGGVPRVVEDSSCNNYCAGDSTVTGCIADADCGTAAPCVVGMASPNPYKNSTDVCINAIMGARFTVPMDTATLSGINIYFEQCTDGEICNVPGPHELGGLTTFGPPFGDRFIFTPNNPLSTDTYYRMTILKDVESSTGVKMNNDYEWVFKTKDDPAPCPVENVMVMPGSTILSAVVPPPIPDVSTKAYTAFPVGPICTLVNPGDYTWAWTSSNLGVATVTGAVINTEVASAVAKGLTYIKAETEGKSGQGLLKVAPDFCAFNPDVCADPDLDGVDECPGSVCDVIADRCMPVMTDWDGDGLNFTPSSGPPGTTISVGGCWFGSSPGSIDIGGLPGDLTCANAWSRNLIVVTTDAALATGAYHLIEVKTEAGRCIGGADNGKLCTVPADCGGNPCDNFSTLNDSGQAAGLPGNPYDFFATVNCARLCDPGSDNAYAYCTGDSDCISGSCSAGAVPPGSGVPGLCPPLQPNTGKEGTNITIDGFNLGPPLNPNISRVYYPTGLADSYLDIINRSGVGAWNSTIISPTVVPAGAESGGVNVQVNNCPSNTLPFGISCSTNGDCDTNCCKYDGAVDAKICKPFEECSTGVPGTPCQLLSNVADNNTCDAGPIVVPGGDYRCIDSAGHLDPVPPATESYPPAGVDDCLVCCDPDINNNDVLGEAGDQQISATGLACTAEVGNCDTNERGFYCGCTTDDQCQDPPTTVGCGLNDGRTDHCCYSRPTIASTNPLAGFVSSCTNFSIEYVFSTGAPGLQMDPSTMELGTSIFVEDGVGNLIPGSIAITPTGFRFMPDPLFETGITIWVRIRADLIKDKYGIAMSNVLNDLRSLNWSTAIDAAVCKIDHIESEWWSGGSNYSPPPLLYTCSTDACEPPALPQNYDAILAPIGPGNERYVRAWPVDINNTPLAGNISIEWSEDDPIGIFNVSHEAGLPWGPCPVSQNDSFSCLLQSDNKSGRGYLVVTADGTTSSYGDIGKATGYVRVNARMCSYPWPNPHFPDNDPIPFEDNIYHYSIWYCRGNEAANLLPEFQRPGDLVSQVFVAAEAGIDELLKQQFFLYRDDTISDDAIGIRIYENEGGKSPEEWYWNQFGLAAPEPQSLTIDGYPAVRAGRTVYVAVWNLAAGVLYSNIYLISYNENASQSTIDIYNRMLDTWEFNINMSPSDKERLQRDMRRLNDLNDIYDKLLDYKGANGFFPKLEGGTYISTMTISKWPSWQDTLGAALGSDLPVDPLNSFDLPYLGPPLLCDETGGFDQNTCWNDTNNQYECPGNTGGDSHSYIYQYLSSPSGETANLYANLEYLGVGSWSNLFPPPEPCTDISNAACDCFNYQFDITGNATDRQGPEINSVDSLTDGAVNVMAGTRILDVSVNDTGSGVGKVEFYIDGFLKYTDAEGGNGWSWDFVTTDYTDGHHTILVRAYDNVGNWTDAIFTTLVDNASGGGAIPPFVTIVSPGEGNTISADVTVSAQGSDNNVIISIVLELEDSLSAVVWTDSCVGNVTNSMTCSKLLQWDADGNTVPDRPNANYILRAVATDSYGNTSSHEISITIDYGDTQDPVINSLEYYYTLPASSLDSDTEFIGQPTIRVNATDDNAVNRMEFYVDDIIRGYGADQGGNNWDWVWDTTGLTNGIHTLTVYVYDAYGNNANQMVGVRINNLIPDTEAPVISFLVPPTPASGSAVDGMITIGAEASDNVKVKVVNFYVDYLLRSSVYVAGPSSYCEDASCLNEISCAAAVADGGCGSIWHAEWQWDLNTNILTDGWHTIQADAVDAVGNRSGSIEIRVNVRGSGGPSITNVCVGPPSGVPGTVFTFYAEVNDPEGVPGEGVKAYIQQPDEVDQVAVDMPRVGGDELSGQYEGTWVSNLLGAFFVDIQAMDVDGNISEVDNITSQAVCGFSAALPVCNNNGICDAGETNADCPADCPITGCGDGICNYTTEDPDNCPGDCNMGWCIYNCRVDYGVANVRGDTCELDGTCNLDGVNVDECTPFPAQPGCANPAEECCCLVNDPPGCI